MRPGTSRARIWRAVFRFVLSRQRFVVAGSALVVIAALTVATLQQASAKPRPLDASGAYVSSTSYPILFVHGFNNNSKVDCGATWNTAISYLQGSHSFNGQTLHWTGAMTKLGFYSADTTCNDNLTNEAWRCSGYYSSGVGTNSESIRHLGCEMAWYIYENYSVYGRSVQAVGHSMGGLIIRWAIYGVHASISPFPPFIYVQDAVTLATPHGGVPVGSTIFTCGGCTEGNEMQSGSSLMNDMYNHAQNPQGDGWGTDWTMIGGVAFYNLGCDVVSSSEATYMTGGHKSYFTSPCYSHGGYLTDTSDSGDAHIHFCDGCTTKPSTWKTSTTMPHSLRHMLYALYAPNW